MASGGDQLALFNQYDDEYCSKSTAVATGIQKISALNGGTPSQQHSNSAVISCMGWDKGQEKQLNSDTTILAAMQNNAAPK